ncbi:MAG: UDP-N-acetylglucosamine 1-carboxyvinyltransferase [Clostridia bacterium]|nr:UDP-N-acetylglucosamine 1-carboxyvinyltransferase [Clostridia bacterium]
MGRYLIKGGKPLYGEIHIQGAKNSVLPIFAAALLTEEKVTITNCPMLTDVENMAEILRSLGATATISDGVAEIKAEQVASYEIPACLAKEIRSSIFLLGSVLARKGKAKVAYPGGCNIGLRPIDIHLKALKEMGVKVEEKEGYILCDAQEVEATAITLDYPSVGATENVMLLASLTEGTTTIANAAQEPEIEDLEQFINAMGGKVSGAGTPFIKIKGVKSLVGAEFRTMGDRIVAGTYLIGAALCGGELTLKGVNPEHLLSLNGKLSKGSCKVVSKNDIIHITASGKVEALDDVVTQPYPGFPTDLQAQICVLASVAKGSSLVVENIFETRFKHLPELIKMGARVKLKDRVAVFNGVDDLYGAEVNSYDLRGGAAMVLAGLRAKGTTIVNDSHYVERGYEDIVRDLTGVGADIKKI